MGIFRKDWPAVVIGIAILVMLALVVLVFPAGKVKAQDHHHPPEHAQLHDQFYRNLIRPDRPGAGPGSCCGNSDCYPVQAEFRQGQWWALRREDNEWIAVPNESVIQNENSPDGRAHLCATLSVTYCFIRPSDGV